MERGRQGQGARPAAVNRQEITTTHSAAPHFHIVQYSCLSE